MSVHGLRSRHDGLGQLTGRQREVLSLMAESRSNASIGRPLCLTERAVIQHVSNIYASSGCCRATRTTSASSP